LALRRAFRDSRLEEIYKKELANVQRRLEVLGVPPHDSIDLAHDVFVTLVGGPIGGHTTWRRLRSVLLKLTYEAARVYKATRTPTGAMGVDALRALDEWGAPDELLDLTRATERALRALDEPFQLAVTLNLIHGRSPGDVARELSTSVGSIRHFIHDGRYKFRCSFARERRRQ
jgi:DNA-directed RNA polymerase specialized sigma24 family protein